jgi:hypothetical protein
MTEYVSTDGLWRWNGQRWVPNRQRHTGWGASLIVLGSLVALFSGLMAIIAFIGLMTAPAIQGGAFGFVVLFALLVAGGGVALLVWGITLLRR